MIKTIKKQKWLTSLLLMGALWMNGQIACTTSICSTNPPPTCEYICNGGFNYNNNPPTGISTPTSQQITRACGWYNSTGTPDYYYSTTAAPTVSIPCNQNGNQGYNLDDGYAGLLADQPTTWYEAIETYFKSPLTNGKDYEISFYLSLADTYDKNLLNSFGIEVGGSPSAITSATYNINTSSVTISGWTKFTFTLTSYATPPEQWMRLGFLSAPTNTDYVSAYNPTPQNCTTSVTPTQSTYYYLDNVSIKEISPLNATASSTTGCTGENFTLTATGADTYTWQPGSLTGSSVVVTPTTTTTYTVSGTSSGGCVVTPTTITIYPAVCCQNPNSGNINLKNVTLVAYSTPTTSAIPWSSLSAGNYYTGNIAIPSSGTITNTLTIVGGLNISTPVTFSNCNISVLEDVAIRQYSTTTIDHSYLWGCDHLWTGVLSYTNLVVTNSWIEDAYIGIDVGFFLGLSSHPGITIDNVLFNKNYYGIIAGTTTMTPGNFKVTGCIFSSRNFGTANYLTTTRYTTLFPNLLAKVPQKIKGSTAHSITANTIRSNIGIYMASLISSTTSPDYFTIGDVATTLSVNATYTNEFDYLNAGIVNAGSKVNIYNNLFSNITTTGYGTAIGAIYHDDNHYHQTGTKVGALGGGSYPTLHYKNIFKTVLDGVTAEDGGALDVSYNDFTTVSRYGVNVKTWQTNSPSTEQVIVSNNSFSTTAYAFYAYDNQTITATVATNTLVQAATNYTNYFNVYINEISKPANTSYSINTNDFSGSLYGVYVINTQNARIVNNTIQVAKPTSTGIYNAPVWLDNSDNCLVKGNNVSCYPTNSGSWNTFGVFANASYSNTVKCNSITAVSSCMKFQGACEPTDIYYNSLNNTGGADPCLYGIWYDNGGQTGNIGHWTGSQWQMSDDIWGDFNYGSGGADTKCQVNSNTSNTCTIYYDASNSPSKPLSLYQPSINIDTYLLPTDLSRAYSATSNSITNSDGCSEAARLMNSNNGTNSSDVTSGSENVEVYDNLPYFAAKKRLFLPVASTSNSGKVIKGANESGFYLVDSLFTSYTISKNIGTLNTAKNTNAAIMANNNQEQHQKDFNSIYAVYLQDDSLVTPEQITALQAMAQLCPFTEGLAVYNARGLIRNWDDSTRYDNFCENNTPDLNIDNNRLASLIQDSQINNSYITFYPNPSNGSLIIENCPENCIFELYDIQGKKVYSGSLNANETLLDLNSFNNGTYLIRIIKDNKTIKQDKLMINR